jgi:putative ABC transport system substrate-binding protein
MDRAPAFRHLLRLAALSILPWLTLASPSIAQSADKPARIGLIAFGASQMNDHWERSLIDGLRERGYVVGKNLVIEHRYAGGSVERMPEIAEELASLKLDAIVTTCTPSTRVMHNASRTTSLVMQTHPHRIRFIDSIHVNDKVGITQKIRF